MHIRTLALQFIALMAATIACVLIDVTDAYAQAGACVQLQNSLATLERNGDFRGLDDNNDQLKDMQRDQQRIESSYVRQGCNADAKAGRKLTPQCTQLARQILAGRDQISKMGKSLDTGNAISDQRQAILQEMARFDCDQLRNGRSNASVDRQNRGNLFDQLFDMFQGHDDGAGGVRGDEFDPYGGYHTVRTLCVRKTDGFYWPISYSTLTDYIAADADQCHAQCPDLDVDLYYYDNPGQEPAQAVNLMGETYSSLPNAFAFRTAFDQTSRCQPVPTYGTVAITDLGDGRTRPIITFGTDTFPMPVPDPRMPQGNVVAAPVDAATYVDIPLPRPRPAAPGEAPKPVVVTPPAATANSAEPKIVQFGDKRVRIVGPMTPYAQLAEAEP